VNKEKVKYVDFVYAFAAFAGGVGLYLMISNWGYDWALLCGYFVGHRLGLGNAVAGTAYFMITICSSLFWGIVAGGGCLFMLMRLRRLRARKSRD